MSNNHLSRKASLDASQGFLTGCSVTLKKEFENERQDLVVCAINCGTLECSYFHSNVNNLMNFKVIVLKFCDLMI